VNVCTIRLMKLTLEVFMNKRFLSIAASTAIMASAIVFTGCGSSSSSTTSSSSSSSSTSGGLTGQLIDAAVAGVTVTGNGTTSTTTNGTGHFSFAANEALTFKLGGQTIGTYTDSSTARPTGSIFGMAEIDSTYASDLAYLLQALDVDGNHDNGINVSYVTSTIMSNAGITTASIKDGGVATAINHKGSQFWTAINSSKAAAGTNLTSTANVASFANLATSATAGVSAATAKAAAYQTALNNVQAARVTANAASASANAFQLNSTNIKGVNVTLANGAWIYFYKNGLNASVSSNITAAGAPMWASITTAGNQVSGSVYVNTSVDNMTILNTGLNMTGGSTSALKVEHSVTGSSTTYAANSSTVSKMRYNVNFTELAGKAVTLSDGKIVTFGALGGYSSQNLTAVTISGINSTGNIAARLHTPGDEWFNNLNVTDRDGTNTTEKIVLISNATGDGYVNLSFEANPSLYANGVVATVWSNITGYVKSAVAMLVSLFS
jgi:predicted lipoprotein with Yx(FWY)xxD motif